MESTGSLEAADLCRRAHGLLADAVRRLEQPMHAADATVPEDLLVDASSHIAVTASLMAANKVVGLRGAAETLTDPLRSVDDVDVHAERDLRAALGQLRTVTARAGDAWLAVGRGRGHLWMAYQLLAFDRLPGVDGLLDAERGAARALAAECATLARTRVG